MTRKSPGRRALLLALLAIGPLSIGCEAILDFDRTPLQPVPDAGLDEEDSGSSAADSGKKKDAKATGDDDDDDDKPDAKADSGKDAGTDSGDAGDSGSNP